MTWSEELVSSENRQIQKMLRDTGRLPRHIAIIMDGNGRWAQERGRMRIDGHKEGMESVRSAVKTSSQLGVSYLTLYAFSIENWKRPLPEVRFLMGLLETYLRKEIDELHANGVRIRTIGKTNALPKSVQRVLKGAIERTAENEGLTLTLALSYGSRWDILRAVQVVAMDIRRGKLSPEDLTEEMISSYLQTSYMPDPDLIIRTSGEVRLSNFLLWEAAYAELYITDGFWPDFRGAELYRALTDFVMRERRFGKISAQLGSESAASSMSTLERILHALK
ncbi:MAG: isoprenyl transferase [Candidatus Kapabacteria bacterium]|nr:isoprenyl transferase [Candidatus Kapabacteria bacterium]